MTGNKKDGMGCNKNYQFNSFYASDGMSVLYILFAGNIAGRFVAIREYMNEERGRGIVYMNMILCL